MGNHKTSFKQRIPLKQSGRGCLIHSINWDTVTLEELNGKNWFIDGDKHEIEIIESSTKETKECV